MSSDLRALVEAVRVARERDGELDGWVNRIGAERAICDALLTSRAVEAVEVLKAWGRAKVNAIDTGSALFRAEHAYEYDGGPREAWEQAGNAHLVARAAETHAESVASNLAMQMALADALAEEV